MAKREINLGFMSMRHASLPDRIAAAADAGFDGISLRADQWQQLRASGWEKIRLTHPPPALRITIEKF